MKTTSIIKDIKAAIGRLDTLEASVARLEKDKQRIISEEDGSLLAKACSEFAQINAGLEIAGPAQELLKESLMNLVNGSGRAYQVSLRRHADTLHEGIDKAINERVLASISEDLRDGLDVYSTKPWQNERKERGDIRQELPWLKGEARLDEIKGNASHAVAILEGSEAEIVRATAVAKKLGCEFPKETKAEPFVPQPERVHTWQVIH